ncbi:alpha/beta hydrolase [Ancylobacter sp. VNQ12]|uniref:alpha/beta hydrolase n=1 Tax=Ancylobacter sp. VNQ12 TaxID=3400920 RepID=UPI003C0D903D
MYTAGVARAAVRRGDIDPADRRYMDFMHAHRIHVVNMTGLKTEDGMNHGKFAERPEVIRLIGQQLATGQPISDQKVNPAGSVNLLDTSIVSASGALMGRRGEGARQGARRMRSRASWGLTVCRDEVCGW